MKLNITITYPSLRRGNSYKEPQASTTQEIDYPWPEGKEYDPLEVCEYIYCMMGNHPVDYFPWFQKVNRELRMYSMSIGCCIEIEGVDKAFICDISGFLTVTKDQLKSWLEYKGERHCADMTALLCWRTFAGLTK